MCELKPYINNNDNNNMPIKKCALCEQNILLYHLNENGDDCALYRARLIL